MAAGFQSASAPLIAYVEEHSYPQPGWAEAVIAAHEGPWAAVGVSMENANPETMVSWAMLFLDFAPAVEVAEPAEVHGPALPPHHLQAIGAGRATTEELHRLLEVEAVLQRALLDRGERLGMESAARQRHLNVSRVRSMIRSQYLGGRQYAPLRVREEGFSAARRLGYALAAPLIVLVQLRRILGHVARTGRTRQLIPRMLPALVLGLVAEQAGETVGYLSDGPGRRARGPADAGAGAGAARGRRRSDPAHDRAPRASLSHREKSG